MAAAILISTFGCANGLTLAGARVYYAMSRDGLFFKSVGKLHPRYHTPVAGLLVQALWTAVLCVSGSYSQLLDYIIFAVLVFYILTIVGLFVLRREVAGMRRGLIERSAIRCCRRFISCMAAWICIVLLRYKPQYTWPGLVLVLLGIPVYFLWSRRAVRRETLRQSIDTQLLDPEDAPHSCPDCCESNRCPCFTQEASEEGEHTLKRSLGALNLITLGIGAVIGAGIFTLTGQAAALHAGPAVALSFVLAGLTCAFAGLCYAEFASIIPIAGRPTLTAMRRWANWWPGLSAGTCASSMPLARRR